jgi:putative ABC transport system permease protein
MYIALATSKNLQTKRKTTLQVIAFNPEQPTLNIPNVNTQ